MQTTTVTVIGAGQAGLAMSRCLTEHDIDHVVLERGEVANSWRTERWDSLRLLTPNWLTRLPGGGYRGSEPDGYMTTGEVVTFLADYAASVAAPVRTRTAVRAVVADRHGYRVDTDQGSVGCRAVVTATGACSQARVPAFAPMLPPTIRQLSPTGYRGPDDVDDGPVLVVGASASGVQLADELARHGRRVTLAVGAHTRVPRMYRGRDIHWWMDAIGLLDTRYDEVDDIVKARRLPSLQLVGSPERRSLDLNALTDLGVELVGRVVGVDGARAQCSGSLANLCADADLKMGRLLDQIDAVAAAHGVDPGDADRPAPTRVPTARTALDLSQFATVVWATGFEPRFSWFDAASFDRKGRLVHDGGVLPRPGLYVIGLPFLRRRKSSFLDGVGPDARYLAGHLDAYLAGRACDRSDARPFDAVPI